MNAADPMFTLVPKWVERSLRRASMSKRRFRRWRGREKEMRRRELLA